MEQSACVYCGSPEGHVVSRQPDIRYFPEREFRIVRCGACGVLYTAPNQTPESIGEYYPAEYGAYTPRQQVLEVFSQEQDLSPDFEEYCRALHEELRPETPRLSRPVWRNRYRRARLDMHGISGAQWYQYAIPVRPNGTRVLYIGSGNPRLFRDYRALPGVELDVIDISSEMCAAYAEVGIRTHCGMISDVEFNAASFDVIFSTHVFEHLLNPKNELGRLADWLKPGGIMVCGLPDYGSVEWRWRPVYYDVPRHQMHLTGRTADRIFGEAGLETAKRIHTPYGYGFFQSRFLRRWQRGLAAGEPEWCKPLPRGMEIASCVLSLVGQSGNVVYYLRRPV